MRGDMKNKLILKQRLKPFTRTIGDDFISNVLTSKGGVKKNNLVFMTTSKNLFH